MTALPSNLTADALRALSPLRPAGHLEPTGRIVETELTLKLGDWSLLSDVRTQAILINGTAPGPILRATEGDLLRVMVTNQMAEPTAIHFHGVPLPNHMDGVPPFTQEPIAPGSQFLYEFYAPQAGTFMYHSHMPQHSMSQIGRGLYGAMLVAPQSTGREPTYQVDMPIVIGTWETSERSRGMMGGFWAVNGKAYPEIPSIKAKQGDLVRLRLINVTQSYHPMHLHGHYFRVIAEDGHPVSDPQILHTVDLAPGKMIDIDFLANNPGTWLFHCHNLMHMMAEGGLAVVLEYGD